MNRLPTARQPRLTRKRLRPLALALLAAGLSSPAFALDYLWLGGTGNWNDASRWSLLGVPGAGDSATLNSSNHQVVLTDTRSLGALFMSAGYLGGSGTLNTGSASFANANLGLSDSTQNTLNIAGSTSFDGSSTTSLRYGQVVNLNGNTTWSAGNSRIDVASAYGGSSSSDPYRVSQLNIGAGTTFTDAGAAAAAGTKTIGYSGGQINNAGTYVRNGLGTTTASYGFNNTGIVQINAGTFAVDDDFRNTGVVSIASGAVLKGIDTGFANHGTLMGTGTIQTRSVNDALVNHGSIDPGNQAVAATLSVVGDLSLMSTSTLYVNLNGIGQNDLLAISDDLTLSGTLAVSVGDFTVNVGDSFVIATFDQLATGTTFTHVTWQGVSGDGWVVDYNAHDITLRVSAVPEPQTWLTLLAGIAVLVARRGTVRRAGGAA